MTQPIYQYLARKPDERLQFNPPLPGSVPRFRKGVEKIPLIVPCFVTRGSAPLPSYDLRPPGCWLVDHFYQLGLNESLTDQTTRGTQPMYPYKAKNQTEGGGFSHRVRKRHSKTDDVRVASATGKNQAEAPSWDDTLSHQGMNVEPPTRYERGPKSLFFTHKNVPQTHLSPNPLPISIRYQYGINTDFIRIDSVLIPY